MGALNRKLPFPRFLIISRPSLSLVGVKMCRTFAPSWCIGAGSHAQGHRTYPAFVHFLTTVTLLAMYITVICSRALLFAFRNPYAVVRTPASPSVLL